MPSACLKARPDINLFLLNLDHALWRSTLDFCYAVDYAAGEA